MSTNKTLPAFLRPADGSEVLLVAYEEGVRGRGQTLWIVEGVVGAVGEWSAGRVVVRYTCSAGL